MPTVPVPYDQRAACAADPGFQNRVRLCSKEHALLVALEPATGTNYRARWSLAYNLLQDVYPYQRITELFVSDGLTVDTVTTGLVPDVLLQARAAAVFDLLAGPVDYVPPVPPTS